eukprot:TRINITY_DN12078_c0_g1_i1.p1 TRINITY_DN12078_c0_g1~~TRINITY_DN12078_c0_g1_i1.p1  ORF type:complete len:199 (+),score=10.81 TRINITY_DN12078_c0_g1_i1:340-936(+)
MRNPVFESIDQIISQIILNKQQLGPNFASPLYFQQYPLLIKMRISKSIIRAQKLSMIFNGAYPLMIRVFLFAKLFFELALKDHYSILHIPLYFESNLMVGIITLKCFSSVFRKNLIKEFKNFCRDYYFQLFSLLFINNYQIAQFQKQFLVLFIITHNNSQLILKITFQVLKQNIYQLFLTSKEQLNFYQTFLVENVNF